MTSPDPTPRIHILGASLSSLTFILSLLNHSNAETTSPPYSISIYEARSPSHITTVKRSITLPPNALRILDRLDGNGALLKRLQEKGFSYERVRVVGLDGDEKGPGMLMGGSLFGYPALRLEWRELVEGLRDAVKGRGGVDVRWEKRCVEIRDGSASRGIELVFADGEVVGLGSQDLLVGVDGIGSVVRRFLYPDVEPAFTGQLTVMARARIEGPVCANTGHLLWSLKEPPMLFLSSESGTLGVCTTSSEAYEVLFIAPFFLRPRTREEWKALSEDGVRMKEMICERYCKEPWPLDVRNAIGGLEAEQLYCWAFNSVDEVPQWCGKEGRVVVLGDAVHAVEPSAGVGAAMGMEDAAGLAGMVHMLWGKERERWERGLKVWEKERKERLRSVVERTRKGSQMRKGGDGADGLIDEAEEVRWLYGWDAGTFLDRLSNTLFSEGFAG